MPEINISNHAGRDAVVNMETVVNPIRVRWLDEQGRQAYSIRVLKSTLDLDMDALQQQFGDPAAVASALIESDPEINLETIGSFLHNTSRVYIDRDYQLVHKAQLFEVIRNPDGTERERRPRELLPQNVAGDLPLPWSGRMIKKSEACRKFVFATKMQLSHVNGLTFDFLYQMAEELQRAESLMLLGAGPKSNQPLILRRGSLPYRGFLEGRVQGDRYCLILHLSNLELKKPADEDA